MHPQLLRSNLGAPALVLIGNLCKFDHCAVGLVVEGGGVQDLRRRFAMGRRQTGDRLARSERRKVMFPSLPAGGFTGWIIDSDRACASTEWHIDVRVIAMSG